MDGASEDGLHWNSLNLENGSPTPIAESTVGFTGVRDPHIIRSYEGDKYWILGTDMQDGFDQLNGSQSIIVWESDVFVSWSESRLVLVFDNSGCA